LITTQHKTGTPEKNEGSVLLFSKTGMVSAGTIQPHKQVEVFRDT
jgi:hypothetical protein